ncbi:hypothetical protein AVEN_197337-1 [Araneus ventricosus]|uniref:Uncharacterized protein n=1 Tax=Araneus ventricosus TaxID=182803 RepID=A0A4Y2ITS3_ARAVE|nr:hypothetical protein AVEN_197337-1 [Araneus ventricosus]
MLQELSNTPLDVFSQFQDSSTVFFPEVNTKEIPPELFDKSDTNLTCGCFPVHQHRTHLQIVRVWTRSRYCLPLCLQVPHRKLEQKYFHKNFFQLGILEGDSEYTGKIGLKIMSRTSDQVLGWCGLLSSDYAFLLSS